ncbi:MAG: flagellar hook-associated protein FlgL [Fimbriimonadaceae bacterium]
MRVSTGYQYDVYNANIRNAMSNYFDAQKRVMTGKRFTRVSEDPVAALTALGARSLRSRLEQLDKNLMVAKEYTGTTENVLDEINSVMKRAYTLAIQGASDATTQESRDAMANEIATLEQRLVDLGNTQGVNGKFIFSGQASDTKPFSAAGGALTFAGDTLPINVEIRPGEVMRANLENADTFFDGLYTTLETLRTDLQGGNVQQLSEVDVANLRTALDDVGAARGLNATKLQEIERLHSEGQRRMDDLTKTISDNEDIDLTEAITEMQMAETAYTATLQVASQGFRLSLMDFLR